MLRLAQKRGAGLLFGGMMVLSAIGLFLPPRWTEMLKAPIQLLVPAQDLLHLLGQRTLNSLDPADPSPEVSRQTLESLARSLLLEQARAAQLADENARLRQLRTTHKLPPVPLLPAKIVALDMVEWRDSALLARGSFRGVRWGDWVSSRLFIDQGRASNVEGGQAVVSLECLLGRVEQVSPYMARVQLLSDVDSPRVEVRIGGLRGDRVAMLDRPYSLKGRGMGLLQISDVPYQEVLRDSDVELLPEEANKRVRVGDYVYSAAGAGGLPVPLMIGRISRLEEDARKRLVVNLIVEPPTKIERMREVYVIPLVPTEPLPSGD
jgi:cell shape-determining protein MreC